MPSHVDFPFMLVLFRGRAAEWLAAEWLSGCFKLISPLQPNWVAAKELQLSYLNSETRFFGIYPYALKSNKVLNSNPGRLGLFGMWV